jgi:hypothetical protein
VNFYPSAGGGTPVDAIYNNPATVLFATTTPTGDLVAGLTAGAVIGPGLNFGGTLVPVGSNPGGGGLGGETYRGVDAVNFSATPFLGFQFVLNGVTDFGWIRLSGSGADLTVVDFAYDTTGQAIAAGQTTAVPEPSSLILGLMALGGAGLAVLRRRGAAAATEVA